MTSSPWEWVLEAPGEVLAPDARSRISLPSSSLIVASSCLSLAVAGTILTEQSNPPSVQPLTLVGWSWLVDLIGFLAASGLMYGVLRVFFARAALPWQDWWKASAVAVIPVHAVLPLALLCRPFGATGLILYTVGEFIVLWVVLRRWTRGTQALSGWPVWGCVLVVLSPLVLVGLWFLVLAAFAVLLALSAVAGVVG